MKVVVNPTQTQFTDFVQTIHEQFDKGGTVIYKKRNEIRVFDVDGTLLNVKKFKVPFFLNRIIYTFFRLTKAQRSYLYSIKLKKKGVETPEPVAYVIKKRRGLIYYCYYISLQVDYNRTMFEFGKGGIEGREHILEKFTEFTANIHKAGFCHQDYSPGNILFKEYDNGDVKFCIVDINRMRFGNVSVSRGCSNFSRLWGQESLFRFVASKYAELRNADTKQCIESVMSARNKFWKNYARKHPLPFILDEADCNK